MDGGSVDWEGKAPGDVVREAMEARGWSQPDLAFALGIKQAAVSQIISGKRGISHAMAKALSIALGIPAPTLARLQVEWELDQAAEPDPIVVARSRVSAQYPLREMVKRGWIAESNDPQVLEAHICKFFGVASLDDVPHLAHAAKRTGHDDIPATQLAWLFRVRQLAAEMHAPLYSRDRLMDALARLSEARADPDGVRLVPRLLNDAGVRFIVVEPLPGSKIDGVCFWLDGQSPVVGMSLRFDRIDNFWFVLAHECAHVLHGHGKSTEMIDTDTDQQWSADIPEEEQIANAAGAEFCVPQRQMESFYLRKNPLFAEREVLAFATRMNVHPGLVVGQLQRLSGRYDLLRRHLVRVRDKLSNSMMMDGWGDVVPVDQ